MLLKPKREIISVSYGSQIIVETENDKVSIKALKKFLNRDYFYKVIDNLKFDKKYVNESYTSPKLLVSTYDDEVLITMEEFKYFKAMFVTYLDDMHNSIPNLIKLINLTGYTDINDTITYINNIEDNPIKYLNKFILNDDLLHLSNITEYIRMLNQYRMMYENIENTLPEFAKTTIV